MGLRVKNVRVCTRLRVSDKINMKYRDDDTQLYSPKRFLSQSHRSQ